MIAFMILIRVIPVIYSLIFFGLLFNLISSAMFDTMTIKDFMKRLFLAIFWPLTLMSPGGRKELENIYRRL